MPRHKARLRSAVAVAMLGGLTAAHAGGQMTFGDDNNTSANDGPPFFGFVRDSDGAAVGDARVTATVKSGGARRHHHQQHRRLQSRRLCQEHQS